MTVRAPSSLSVSTITLRFGSSARTRKMRLPPMPSIGLGMASPAASMKAARRAHRGSPASAARNRRTRQCDLLPEWSRSAAGRLKRAPLRARPVRAARSPSRIRCRRVGPCASGRHRRRRGAAWCRPSEYQHASSSASCSRTASASTPVSLAQASRLDRRRPDFVPARLRGPHHGDARILGGLERRQRIDDEENAHQAATATSAAGSVRSISIAAASAARRATTP